jgi:hypothetical protein
MWLRLGQVFLPFFKFKFSCATTIAAISLGDEMFRGDRIPLSLVKKAGNISHPYPITGTPGLTEIPV